MKNGKSWQRNKSHEKSQMEIIELKNIITEIKTNLWGGLIRRVEMTEVRTSEF